MTRDFQKEFEDIVKYTIVPFFKKLGFRRNGNGFNRETNDIVQVVSIQKNKWNHQDNVSFTFNVGFFNGDIFKESWGKEVPKFIKEYECQIRFRLREVTKKTDHWYELNENHEITDLETEIVGHLDNFLKPILEDTQTLVSLKMLLRRNSGFKIMTPIIIQVLLLLKTGEREEAEQLFKDEYNDSLYPKESSSVVVYPDGRRVERISTPSVNKVYLERLKIFVASNEIEF